MGRRVTFLFSTVMTVVMASTCWGGSVSIPNVFVSGQKAYASQVNQNFTALRDAVNVNYAEYLSTKNKADANLSAITILQSDKQERVSSTCPIGQAIRVINYDGSVECEIVGGGGGAGDITSVQTSAPLSGGATSGDVTISLLPGGITSSYLETWSVISSKVAPSAIDTDQLAPGAVIGEKIAGGAVDSSKILDGTVTSADIANGTVASADIADGTITSSDIADGTIVSADIATGTIVSNNIQDGTITGADINPVFVQNRVSGFCTTGESIRVINMDGSVVCEVDDSGAGSGSGDITSVLTTAPLAGGASSGDVSLSLQAGGITAVYLSADSVAASHIRADAVGASEIATGAVTSTEILNGTITSDDILTSSVQARVAGSCPEGSSIRVITEGGTVSCESDDAAASTTGGVSGDITAVLVSAPLSGGALSGDANISLLQDGITDFYLATGSVGALEIQSDAVGSAEIQTDAVGSAEIQTGGVGTSEIEDGSVTSTDIADGTITGTDIASGTVGSGNIATGAIGSAHIAANAITSIHIASNAVGLDEIQITEVQKRVSDSCPDGESIRTIYADGTVACEKDDVGSTIDAITAGSGLVGGGIADTVNIAIGTEAVTSAHLAPDSVGSSEIASSAVGGDEIATGAVASVDIADNSITSADIQNGTLTYLDTDVNSIQRRVATICGNAYAIQGITNTGAVTCEPIPQGDITAVYAGTGLSGGSLSGNATLNVSGVTGSEITDGTITDVDILDEPGVASVLNWASYALTTSVTDVMSASITIPTPGYVLAIATGTMIFSHTYNYSQTARIAVNDDSTSLPGYYQSLIYPSVLPTGSYYTTFAYSGVFYFSSSGTKTLYLVGYKTGGTGTISVYDRQLNLVFIPTAYGSVNTLFDSTGGFGGGEEERPPLPE